MKRRLPKHNVRRMAAISKTGEVSSLTNNGEVVLYVFALRLGITNWRHSPFHDYQQGRTTSTMRVALGE